MRRKDTTTGSVSWTVLESKILPLHRGSIPNITINLYKYILLGNLDTDGSTTIN